MCGRVGRENSWKYPAKGLRLSDDLEKRVSKLETDVAVLTKGQESLVKSVDDGFDLIRSELKGDLVKRNGQLAMIVKALSAVMVAAVTAVAAWLMLQVKTG